MTHDVTSRTPLAFAAKGSKLQLKTDIDALGPEVGAVAGKARGGVRTGVAPPVGLGQVDSAVNLVGGPFDAVPLDEVVADQNAEARGNLIAERQRQFGNNGEIGAGVSADVAGLGKGAARDCGGSTVGVEGGGAVDVDDMRGSAEADLRDGVEVKSAVGPVDAGTIWPP